MSLNRTVLQNGCVITLDKGLGDFRRADVLIEGSKIAAVGPDLAAGDAEVRAWLKAWIPEYVPPGGVAGTPQGAEPLLALRGR